MVTLCLGSGFSAGLGQKCAPQVAFWSPVGGRGMFCLTDQPEGKMGLEREPADSLGDIGGSKSGVS